MTKCEHKEYWFWRQKVFQREASTNLLLLSNRNILFLECSRKYQTYISDFLTLFEYIPRIKIKSKCENEDDLDLFLNGPSIIRNGIVIPMLLIKAIFSQVFHQSVSFSSRSMNMRALVKVLILTKGIFLLLVLRNYYSLKASNFRCL